VYLPLATSAMTLTAADTQRPLLDFEHRTPKADKNGKPIYALCLFAHQLGAVMTVKVAGEPTGIERGTPLTITSLTAISWEMDGREGPSFRAERIEAAVAGVSVDSYHRAFRTGEVPGRKIRGRWIVLRVQPHQFIDEEIGA
jgi:hypothetical protein